MLEFLTVPLRCEKHDTLSGAFGGGDFYNQETSMFVAFKKSSSALLAHSASLLSLALSTPATAPTTGRA